MYTNKNIYKKMKKDNLYLLYQKQVKDKDTAVYSLIKNTLAKTQCIFVYRGLPNTIPQIELERMLQESGGCFVTEVDGSLYALSGSAGGELDVYNRPTIYTVSNVALNLNRNFKIDEEGILMLNDTNGNSLLPIIGKYAVLLTDGFISINTATVLSRITMLISASDDKTKESADAFVSKIIDGEFSVIGENAFFKGVNMQAAPTANSMYLTQLIETIQYFKASLYNDLGLNSNFNMKRERLTSGEVNMNEDILLPYIDNMLKTRQTAVERINEKYGTEITVSLGSSWRLGHEYYENQVEEIDTENAPTYPTTDEIEESEGGEYNEDVAEKKEPIEESTEEYIEETKKSKIEETKKSKEDEV